MTKLSTGMQRVIEGKYFSVQYIVSYRDIHAYVRGVIKKFAEKCYHIRLLLSIAIKIHR